MNYEEANVRKQELNEKVDGLSKKLNDLLKDHKASNGFISNEITSRPEIKAVQKEYDLAFSELRTFNKWFIKNYRKQHAKSITNKRNNK